MGDTRRGEAAHSAAAKARGRVRQQRYRGRVRTDRANGAGVVGQRGGRVGATAGGSLASALAHIETSLWRDTLADGHEHAALLDAHGRVLAVGAGDEESMPRIGPGSRVGLVYTHTHPPELPFSFTDVRVASRDQFAETRAVTPKYVYTLAPHNSQWPDMLTLVPRYRTLYARSYEAYFASARYQRHGRRLEAAARANPGLYQRVSDDREGWARHEALQALAREFDLRYTRTRRMRTSARS